MFRLHLLLSGVSAALTTSSLFLGRALYGLAAAPQARTDPNFASLGEITLRKTARFLDT